MIKLNIRIGLFVITCSLITSAQGEQWKSIVESESKDVYFYDPNTLLRDGEKIEYWELTNFKSPVIVESLVFKSSKSQVLLDCENNKYKTLNAIDYDSDYARGNIVNVSMVEKTYWHSIDEGSVADVIQITLCKKLKMKDLQ